MNIDIIGESGYDQALYGLGLSYGITSDIQFEYYINDIQLKETMKKIAYKLYNKDGGHNKFLESIQMWIKIDAPRFWWSEADTYRVGESKQSESTMHTIMKNKFKQEMFESQVPQVIIDELEKYRLSSQFNDLKNILPEGFLQTRIWNLNYKVLRNIVFQRKNHKLIQWKYFCDYIMNYAKNKEFFDDIKY